MNLMETNFNSEFGRELKKIFQIYKPKKLIETGTYLGTGSTAILSSLLKDMGFTKTKLLTIEINPTHYSQAIANIKKLGLSDFVTFYNGLSIERNQLPTRKEINKKFVIDNWPTGIYIDHNVIQRADLYYKETDFIDLPDNLLLRCLEAFDFHPDFVLLDSGGHIGYIEFLTLLNTLIYPCLIALDDIYHVKHYESFHSIQKDKRFEILKVSKEKFGFCIAHFTPR